jgi:hypothetical protein
MTIENLLLSSYGELAVTAMVYNWLMLGAERFTRQRLEALAHAESRASGKVPSVLFLCVHNALRSQMALGWFTHLAGDKAIAWSGGSEPVAQVNPAAGGDPSHSRRDTRPGNNARARSGNCLKGRDRTQCPYNGRCCVQLSFSRPGVAELL